jgi:prophage antirepressor-like protein
MELNILQDLNENFSLSFISQSTNIYFNSLDICKNLDYKNPWDAIKNM